MRKSILSMAVLLVAGSAAAQDPEETRIPFQNTAKFDFTSAIAGVGVGQSVVLASVPDSTRYVITHFSARCETTKAATGVGPLVLNVSSPVLFGTPDSAAVDVWFPMVLQGPDTYQPLLVNTFQVLKVWAASTPTHLYAGGGTKVTVTGRMGGYENIIDAPTPLHPHCNVTISGFLIFPKS